MALVQGSLSASRCSVVARACSFSRLFTAVMSTQAALAKTGMSWDDITWFVPHQANLRINEKVVEVAKIPAEKVLNSIEFYGNTTAATVPLTIDYWRQQGKVKKGDRILSSVFGSGFTWGAAIFTL